MLILYIIFQFFLLIANAVSLYDKAMNHIYKNLYLGNRKAAQIENFLKMYDIHTVINCAAELQNDYKDVISYDLNLYDMPEEKIILVFERAYDFVKKHLDHNILVHCYMGISRSASFIIFYLMKEEKWDYDTCFEFVRKKRPCIEPNYGFERQLRDYYNQYINNK